MPYYVSLHSIDSFVSISNTRCLAPPSSFHMSLKHKTKMKGDSCDGNATGLNLKSELK